MGGIPIVAIGFEVTNALEAYRHKHGLTEGLSSFKEILRNLESKLLIPLHLARTEDSSGLSRMFLCCYIDYELKVYDCEELMAMPVPPEFKLVKELFGTDGELRRFFSPYGQIYSYDENGRTRIG